MTSRRWQRLLAALVALAALLLSSCTSSAPHRKFGKCEVSCMGTIDGADYAIKVPKNWNGTLLVYSHGYQFADTTPHFLSPLDATGAGQDPVSTALLDQGFALAGSAWAAKGWAVSDGVDAANKLYDKFSQMFGKPKRTYAWGSSLGGLVTEQLAEHADWVDGAAPMCGVVGGPLPNFDNWLEALVASQALLGVKFTLTGALSADQAKQETVEANAAINAAASDRDGGGAAKLLYLADLLGLPSKSSGFFSNNSSRELVGAAGQNLAGYLSNGAQFLGEARAQFGGNPAKMYSAAQAPALSSQEQAAIAALHGDPSTFAAKIDAAQAPSTSSAARNKLAETGDPTGELKVPTVTMHGIYDPLAIDANETILHDLAAEKKQSNRLQQLFVGPYEGAPSQSAFYAHCGFLPRQEVGLIDTLDQWVRQGPRPAANDIVDNLGSGVDPNYNLPKWPSGAIH